MAKIGRPTRLISYDTDLNIQRRQEGKPSVYRLLRTRTLLYAGIIATVSAVMLYTLATRQSEGMSVLHDRNPVFVRLSDGAIRNAYTVRLVNKRLERREFALSLEGLPGSFVDIVGVPVRPDRRLIVEAGPDQTREVRVLVTDYNFSLPTSTPIVFHLIDIDSGEQTQAADFFRGP
jgi:polyferredoxin